ncbi:adenosylmethionine--8-amino-7-oxononanoate transaminase [Putridiphycobacter roseus]|uniref:Adenosylmethionine-8-amino-7-oxononanoate aminotransferase n=1 Tax=Putridiphycobacter roseus TaxID=2219161 RepID=A0A2W1NJ53_9FLAO|nr:adenosylmethionine--8-amino-7-oxononanoate transaminase [Putridiphycobacter roseus]PZE17986.1 adenosylmethionine--8-amino-7-oxononanoate transaminase [Putridiphycobacter roseus]
MSELINKDQAYVWHPFTQVQTSRPPLPIVSAKDALLFAEDGKQYIDCNSAWWTILHGHGNAHIGQAISAQYQTLDHTVFAGVTHPKAAEVAERIVQLLPRNFEKVFYSDNGSTATEVAIKMSLQYWYNKGNAKSKFLAIEGAYHGDTFGAMSVGERDLFNAPFEHLFFDVDYLPFPTAENWEVVKAQAAALLATNEYAGFIFEPLVQGASGMKMYDKNWLNELIGIAKQNAVLTIADEVMTGFYRLGTLFAIDQVENKPDIICFSKGITGGVLPVGLTVTSNEIHDVFLSDKFARGFLHGHSFTGNPIICAAIAASLDLLALPETKDKIASICNWQKGYAEKFKNHPKLKDVRLAGTILAFEIKVKDKGSYFSDIRNIAYHYFIDHGMLIRPLGNVFFINAPYCTTKEQFDEIYTVVESFLDQLP